MKTKHILFLICIFISFALLAACASQPGKTLPPFNAQSFQGERVPKVEQLYFVLDASSSMEKLCGDYARFDVAKAIVDNFNQTMPDLKIETALRGFGFSPDLSDKQTALFYGPRQYSRTGLAEGLDKIIKPGGPSPMGKALYEAAADLKESQGKVAMVIISDGENMGSYQLDAAEALVSELGDRLCLYTVLVGDSPNGKAFLEKIAAIPGCGKFTSAKRVIPSADMAAYVEDVLLAKQVDSDRDGVYDRSDQCPNTPAGVSVDDLGCALDSDGDGVADYRDNCPGTLQGAEVDDSGCALDSDNDGVSDYQDKCPDTPEGAEVDNRGCPVDSDGDGVFDYKDKCMNTPQGASVNNRGCWIVEDLRFEVGKADIRQTYYDNLNEIVSILKQNPNMDAEIQGHTDSQGSAEMNQKLSENRAAAVRDFLVKKGIDEDRLSYKGYGETNPLASNDTARGRAKNRRVEIKPLY